MLLCFRDHYVFTTQSLTESRWPSGLRRCVKVAVSSEAWVRTPLLTIFFIFRFQPICSEYFFLPCCGYRIYPADNWIFVRRYSSHHKCLLFAQFGLSFNSISPSYSGSYGQINPVSLRQHLIAIVSAAMIAIMKQAFFEQASRVRKTMTCGRH